MDQATHNKIVSFIWGIADDVLRDLFKRGKYPDVILPMCVIRRMDAVLEPTKKMVLETKDLLDKSERIFLLDVREPQEWQICRIPGAHLIPLGQLPANMNQLNSADDIVAYCRSGVRSGKAVDLLRKSGFQKIKNLKGGILGWADKVDPAVPKY